jgi:anthranilate phosphoribosyltransferase
MKPGTIAEMGAPGNLRNLLSALTKQPLVRYACAPMDQSIDDPIQSALRHLAEGESLTESEAAAAFEAVMAGGGSPARLGALLLGLRARGETAEELAGAVRALRSAMRRVEVPGFESLVDTCGTGGGRIRTLNISTAAALVAAGAGVRVAKHGNRSFTSRSGSADVLEALGVGVDLAPEEVARVLDVAGVAFLFAPTYHPAMRHAAPVRRELAVATVMNMVGPLANPAGVTRQVVGVAESRHGALMAGAMQRLGTAHGLVVHALVGVDEIAPLGATLVWEVRDGVVQEWQLDPADYGLATADLRGTEGGEPAENAAAIEALLLDPAGAPAALRAAVLLNAGAAIAVSGQVNDLRAGIASAQTALESGAAMSRLRRLREVVPIRTS